MNLKLIPVIGALCLAGTACSKDGATPSFDEAAPVVKVLSPQENDVFPKGASIPITIQFADELGLHAYFVYMMNESTGQPSLVEKKHIHAKTWVVEQEYQLPGGDSGPFRLDIEATDHEFNTAWISVPITVE
ncbi:MAG: hypothetical protein KDC66_16200 [Phaeodactylibacter sp.]|nr:hypothetical protein [Phaeodactylibacter sp.]